MTLVENMLPRDRVLNALNGLPVDRPPVSNPTSVLTVELMDLIDIHTEMVERLNVPLILHICGRTVDRMDYIAQTGMAAFHFDSKNGAREASDIMQGRTRLVGNINSPVTLYAGTPDEVKREAFEALDGGVQIIAPEGAVPISTKLENILAIPEAVPEWAAARSLN